VGLPWHLAFIQRTPRILRGATLPYASGETPAIGDYVADEWEQQGTVIRVSSTPIVGDSVIVRWHDGERDLPLTPAKQFILISRKPRARPAG